MRIVFSLWQLLPFKKREEKREKSPKWNWLIQSDKTEIDCKFDENFHFEKSHVDWQTRGSGVIRNCFGYFHCEVSVCQWPALINVTFDRISSVQHRFGVDAQCDLHTSEAQQLMWLLSFHTLVYMWYALRSIDEYLSHSSPPYRSCPVHILTSFQCIKLYDENEMTNVYQLPIEHFKLSIYEFRSFAHSRHIKLDHAFCCFDVQRWTKMVKVCNQAESLIIITVNAITTVICITFEWMNDVQPNETHIVRTESV